MTSPIAITLKSASDLSSTEIADCYALAAQTGIHLKPGAIESVHLIHNPTLIQAHQAGRLVGFQSHSFYQVQTPFRRKKLSLIYGGLAFQNAEAAGQGIAHRMVGHYMRNILGPFWPLRDYAFIIGTVNPRLIQLMGIQHRLYLPADGALTPILTRFVREFSRQTRSNPHSINDQLVVSPGGNLHARSEITDQWPRMYRASQERYNQLAYALKLVDADAGRHYLTGNFLLVLGRSSRSRLLKASWTYGSKWLRNRVRLAGCQEVNVQIAR